MNLDELRTQIDAVDDSLVELFQKRMDIAAQIAEYKRENGLPILQSAREREKLAAISAGAPEEMQRYLRVLYSLLFELSRTYQGALYRSDTDLYRTITRAIEETPKVFPKQAAVACQGVEGAYAQLACERLFSAPSIQFFRNFDGIFSAIEAGLCRYGILPIENSTAGSVRQELPEQVAGSVKNSGNRGTRNKRPAGTRRQPEGIARQSGIGPNGYTVIAVRGIRNAAPGQLLPAEIAEDGKGILRQARIDQSYGHHHGSFYWNTIIIASHYRFFNALSALIRIEISFFVPLSVKKC